MMQRIKNMKIGKKIGIGFGTMIGIFSIMGVLSILNIKKVQLETHRLTKEYIPQVEISNHLERHALLTMFNMQGYVLSDENDEFYLEEAQKYFEEVKKDILEAQKLSQNLNMASLEQSLKQGAEILKKYQEVAQQTVQLQGAIAENRKHLDAAAVIYIKNIQEFSKAQHHFMKDDLSANLDVLSYFERLKKIDLLEKVLSIGNKIRIDNFKAQAFDNLEGIQNALKLFDGLKAALDEVDAVTHQADNKKRILEIRRGGQNYQKAMNELLVNWLSLKKISESRVQFAEDLRDIAQDTSLIVMKKMMNMADQTALSLTWISKALIAGLLICFIGGMILAIYITQGITRPIRKIVDFIKHFGKGDLSAQVDIDTKDEIGQVAKVMNVSVKNLRKMMQELTESANTLSSSSEELSAISAQMASSFEKMNSQTDKVAVTSEQVTGSVGMAAAAVEQASSSVSNIASMTEEMSSNFNNMAEFAKKTSDNVSDMAQSSEDISSQINSVASASEEMSASLNEVARNTAQASRISQNANQRTDQINTRIEALVSSSKRIGKIMEVIKDIADQTNMLALNATIEAAGAGDAGKGFAVVASEIKALAKQSAGATDEIAGQIEEIQTSTNDVVLAIEDINQVINDIADINAMIAASAEEQTSTASEISRSVAYAATTVKDVAGNANESAKLVDEIAKATQESSQTVVDVSQNIDELLTGIQEVAHSSNEAAQNVNHISMNIKAMSEASRQAVMGASQTETSSKELAEMAFKLAEIVNRFKL